MARVSDLTDLLRLQAHLRARPEGPYTDRKGQPCRHPGGLYSQSLGEVLSHMRELTEVIPPEAHPDTLRTTWPKVMSALKALLVELDSHADDLKTIIVAAGTRPDKKTSQVSRQIDGIFDELVGRPINRVKHNGEKFEACYCFNQEFTVYGYYVAGMRPDGAIGPSAHAHGSTGTHWSFSVTLRRLLGQLALAAGTVYPHVRSSLALPLPIWSQQERTDLCAVANWLKRCAPFCFPNEVHVRVPEFGLSGDEPYLRIATLKRPRSAYTRPGVAWSRQFSGDGVTMRFSVM